jgi:hypothetical protein
MGLIAKLDLEAPNLGNYYPSLDVLATLDPHMERERVCSNAAWGCPLVGKPGRRHTFKFISPAEGDPSGRARVIFQEGSAFAP